MLRLATVLAREIAARAQRNPAVWILDADLGDSYGLDEIELKSLGHRFVQVGIAEQTMVSIAGGLAALGARPWLFSFAAFLCARAYDQIRLCVSHTKLPVALVGSHAGGCAGANGKSHAMMNDVAIMASLPNVEVWAPADSNDITVVADVALACDGPLYIRLPRDPQPALPGIAGLIRVFGNPKSMCLVSTGLGTQWAMNARSALQRSGLDVAVIHVMRLDPLPYVQLADHLANVNCLVVVEDHYLTGGLGDSLRRYFPGKAVVSFAWPDSWAGASGAASDLRHACGLDDQSLSAVCLRQLSRATGSSP